MQDLYLIFRLFAFSQILFCILFFIWNYRRRIDLLYISTLLCVECYLVMPFIDSNIRYLFYPLALGGNAIPALLWLLTQRIFHDDFRVHPLMLIIMASYLSLTVMGDLVQFGAIDSGHSVSEVNRFVFDFIPQLVKLALVLHVIYIALEGRRNDLLERRRRLRSPYAGIGAVMTALVIITELWIQGPAPVFIETLGSALFCVGSFALCLYLFRLNPDVFDTAPPRVELDYNEAEQEQWTKSLNQQMTVQRFYARHGATIGDLAHELGMPEYRLRRLINKSMGFSNFNQFMNSYRIREAAERLDGSDLPILTIALDVGFKSISAFNKSFREQFHQTPSGYRQKT
jgi:AraC-like DNA-binding protein